MKMMMGRSAAKAGLQATHAIAMSRARRPWTC